jgi:hypothetical protein
MPAIKLHVFKIRDDAHRKLAEVLASGEHPRACCREDTNDQEPYQVWSDGPEPHVLPPEPHKAAAITEDEMLDKLAIKILAHLDKKLVK